MQHTDSILIVDFGSQVTQLIARRVREAGVYSEIAPFQSAEEAFDRMKPAGIILSGGPASVTLATSPRAPQRFFEAGIPILGICYGQQLMSAQLGGNVVISGNAANGTSELSKNGSGSLTFSGPLTKTGNVNLNLGTLAFTGTAATVDQVHLLGGAGSTLAVGSGQGLCRLAPAAVQQGFCRCHAHP